MGSALREIQEMYDDKLEMMKTEIETSYSHKVVLRLWLWCQCCGVGVVELLC